MTQIGLFDVKGQRLAKAALRKTLRKTFRLACAALDMQHGRHRGWHEATIQLCDTTPIVRDLPETGGCARCTAAPLCAHRVQS